VKASQSYDKGRGYSIGIFTNFLEEKKRKQGEYKENPPFSLPFFHEIKIRQNAYCILGKNGKGFLRTLEGSTPEVREQKSHCALSILRNTMAF